METGCVQPVWVQPVCITTRNGDLQNLTQQNQTSLKFQRSRFTERRKPEWTFVGTLGRNLEISPVTRRMNWHPGKGQMKEMHPSRNSGLLTTRSGKVTWIIPRKGTGERNLRNKLRHNQDYHMLCPSNSNRKRRNNLSLQIFSHPFHKSLVKLHRFCLPLYPPQCLQYLLLPWERLLRP